MGYPDWIQVTIQNNTNQTLRIADLYLHWGKLYDYPNKDSTVNDDTVNGKKIGPNDSFSFASCGRENAVHGTEGDLNVYLGDSGDRVFKLYWDCPWAGDNQLNATYVKNKWFANVPNISKSQAIGSVTINVFTTG